MDSTTRDLVKGHVEKAYTDERETVDYELYAGSDRTDALAAVDEATRFVQAAADLLRRDGFME